MRQPLGQALELGTDRSVELLTGDLLREGRPVIDRLRNRALNRLLPPPIRATAALGTTPSVTARIAATTCTTLGTRLAVGPTATLRAGLAIRPATTLRAGLTIRATATLRAAFTIGTGSSLRATRAFGTTAASGAGIATLSPTWGVASTSVGHDSCSSMFV
ncbi:MAG: hypothetical protein WAW88_15500 [Nocardioides sp.]